MIHMCANLVAGVATVSVSLCGDPTGVACWELLNSLYVCVHGGMIFGLTSSTFNNSTNKNRNKSNNKNKNHINNNILAKRHLSFDFWEKEKKKVAKVNKSCITTFCSSSKQTKLL